MGRCGTAGTSPVSAGATALAALLSVVLAAVLASRNGLIERAMLVHSAFSSSLNGRRRLIFSAASWRCLSARARAWAFLADLPRSDRQPSDPPWWRRG